jgi:hypothetical protein
LVRVVDSQEEVEVVGREDHAVAEDAEPALGTAEDPADDLVEDEARAQEESGLEGADSDFDERAVLWDESNRS